MTSRNASCSATNASRRSSSARNRQVQSSAASRMTAISSSDRSSRPRIQGPVEIPGVGEGWNQRVYARRVVGLEIRNEVQRPRKRAKRLKGLLHAELIWFLAGSRAVCQEQDFVLRQIWPDLLVSQPFPKIERTDDTLIGDGRSPSANDRCSVERGQDQQPSSDFGRRPQIDLEFVLGQFVVWSSWATVHALTGLARR